jgi:serine protease Do
VSQGIVSALARERIGSEYVLNYTQTDAAVNPGNSGGPLFNLWGSVVGINSMIASVSGGFEGMSFVLPAEYITKAFKQYRRTGNLKIGAMWASFKYCDEKLTVTGVYPDGPAGSAGIKPTDEILQIDDLNLGAVNPKDRLKAAITHMLYMSPGETVTMTVRRDGKSLSMRVTLRELNKEVLSRPPWAPIPSKPGTSDVDLKKSIYNL